MAAVGYLPTAEVFLELPHLSLQQQTRGVVPFGLRTVGSGIDRVRVVGGELSTMCHRHDGVERRRALDINQISLLTPTLAGDLRDATSRLPLRGCGHWLGSLVVVLSESATRHGQQLL